MDPTNAIVKQATELANDAAKLAEKAAGLVNDHLVSCPRHRQLA